MTYIEFMDVKKQLSGSLKNLRSSKDITQNELADITLMHVDTVKEIENINSYTHHSFYNLYKIAKYFGITLDELYHGTTSMPQETQLLYRIKKLSPIERSMIEAYLITRNK